MIFNKETLIEFFHELDNELKESVELFVIGGSAAAIAFNSKEGIADVDTWSSEENITQAYQRVVSKFKHLRIPLSPAYVHIKSPKIRERFFLYEEVQFVNLKLFFPEAEDLFLLKAQRADEKDIGDLQALHEIKKCSSDLILKRFKNDVLPYNYSSDDMLKIKYLVCIAKVFGEKTAEKHEHAIL